MTMQSLLVFQSKIFRRRLRFDIYNVVKNMLKTYSSILSKTLKHYNIWAFYLKKFDVKKNAQQKIINDVFGPIIENMFLGFNRIYL